MSVATPAVTTTKRPPAAVHPRAAHPAPSAGSALRALVRRGLLDNRRAPLVWGAPLGAMSGCVAVLYPSIRDSLSTLTQDYPSGLKQAFGITDLGSLEAFLHAEMFSLFLPLAIAYFAIRCVAASIAGAEEHGYLDTVLATPVSRRMLVAGAVATAALSVAGALLVMGVLTALGAAIAGEPLPVGHLAGALAGVWALAMFFAGCATLASGLLHRAPIVLGSGAALLGGMYLLDVLGKLTDAVAGLRWLSAFRYYGAPLIDGVDVIGLIVLVAAGAVLATAGAACYERRDIR
jgi:ABC-2 type transport system permease protein